MREDEVRRSRRELFRELDRDRVSEVELDGQRWYRCKDGVWRSEDELEVRITASRYRD